MNNRFLFGVLVALGIVSYVSGCYRGRHQPVAVSDTVYAERIVEKHDTVPVEKVVKVVEKVKIPVVRTVYVGDSCNDAVGEVSDTVGFEVVQKRYSDDSTYTAYVSGLRHGDYPRLDSVAVIQRMVERTVTNTIYREKKGLRVKLRPALGGGYDPINRQWGVYVGGAVVLDW